MKKLDKEVVRIVVMSILAGVGTGVIWGFGLILGAIVKAVRGFR